MRIPMRGVKSRINKGNFQNQKKLSIEVLEEELESIVMEKYVSKNQHESTSQITLALVV